MAQTLPASSVSISAMPSISSSLPLNHSRAFSHSVGPRDAAGAVGTAGEFGQLLEFLYGAAGIYLFGLHHPTFSVAAPTSARASFHDVGGLVGCLAGDGERRGDADGIRLEAALADEQAADAAGLEEADCRHRVWREVLPGELHGQHQAPPADLGDDSLWSSAILRGGPSGADLVGVGLQVVIQDVIQVRQGARRRDRVPAEGGEVEVRRDGFDYIGPADDSSYGESVARLAITIMSGSTSKASMPQKCSPVRPKPVWTSSEIKSIPVSSRISFTRSK